MTQDDKSTIGGEKLRQALISSGRFNKDGAISMINKMIDKGNLKSPMQDTYMRVSSAKK
jgi:hypothetical protein